MICFSHVSFPDFLFLIRNYSLKVQSLEAGSHLVSGSSHSFPLPLPPWALLVSQRPRNSELGTRQM